MMFTLNVNTFSKEGMAKMKNANGTCESTSMHNITGDHGTKKIRTGQGLFFLCTKMELSRRKCSLAGGEGGRTTE